MGPIVLLATSLSSAPAEVEPIPVSLEWRAPDECPGADELRRRIEATLGRTLRFDPEAGARIDAAVRRIGDSYRVELVTAIGDAHEHRTLTASACSDAVDATALVIGLALEPFAAAELVPTPPADPDEPERVAPREEAPDVWPGRAPTPSLPTPEDQPPLRASARRHRHRAGLLVGAGGAFALTDPVSGGVVGGLAWLPPHARLELAVQHWFANAPDEERGADVSLTAAALRGGWVPQWGRFELAIGAGIEAGGMTAAGRGEGVVAARATVPFIGLLLPVDFAFVASDRLALRARVEGVFVPQRPQFHLAGPSDNEVVWTASPASARVTLAVELRMPGTKK